MKNIKEFENKIIQGDALEQLKKLPAESIDCSICSPPYWALRDYGVKGQLGLEPTFQEYINKLCDIFDEVKRVLKKKGTCWVVIGDTYSGNSSYSAKGRQGFGNDKIGNMKEYLDPKLPARKRGREMVDMDNIQNKCLVQIPSRFAIEMTNRGWILRNEVIWYKSNCMPSSIKDRFTVDFEKMFFFVKNKKYYFEQQIEPSDDQSEQDYRRVLRRKNADKYQMKKPYQNNFPKSFRENGRNKRCVWKVATKPYSEAHFAVYPEELIETPIKAGCPQFVCSKCGKAREKIYDKKTTFHSGSGKSNNPPKGKWDGLEQQISGDYDIRMGPKIEFIDKGYDDCGCGAKFEGGIVLDIFMGSGTTASVARQFGRKYLGIELNPEYIKLAEKR